MRVGLQLDVAGDPAEALTEARTAEALGYDLVTAGEHVFFHGPVSNAFVTLSAVAAVTSRVRLVSALTVLPMYPMALAAKMAATLERLSQGRFELGIGVGGEYPAEFAAAGVPVAGRGRAVDEALPVLRRLLAGERVTATGSWGALEDTVLDPAPGRPPPIWIGGRTPAAQRRAARFGDVWLPYLTTPDRYAASLAAVRDQAEPLGRSVAGAVYLWGSVDEDAGRARDDAVATVSRLYDQDFTRYADRYLVHGDPDAVARQLQSYADAGADTVIFAPACPIERRQHVIELFASTVAPALAPPAS